MINANPDNCCGGQGQCPPSPGPTSLHFEIPDLGCSVDVPRTGDNFWGLASGCSLCGSQIGFSALCAGDGNWSISITSAAVAALEPERRGP